MKLEIGQKVYLEPTNANSYRNREIVETYITKIGRKYIELEGYYNKFSIEDLCDVSAYSPSWKLYFSKQEIEDKNERNKILDTLHGIFSTYGVNKLSLNQLRAVLDIVTKERS